MVKKRMVAKLKAIQAELRRRKHHPTTEVGGWLRTVVLGYYQYHAVPGNLTQLWRALSFAVSEDRCESEPDLMPKQVAHLNED